MTLFASVKVIFGFLLNLGTPETDAIRTSHRRKWLDGTVFFTEAAKSQPSPFYTTVKGYRRLAAKTFAPPRVENIRLIVDDPETRAAFVCETIDPCLDYRQPMSLFSGNAFPSRQEVIDKASPLRMLWDQFESASARFTGPGGEARSIGSLFDYNKAAAMVVCSNYSELAAKRGRTLKHARAAIYLQAMAGAVAAGAAFVWGDHLFSARANVDLAGVFAGAVGLATGVLILSVGLRAKRRYADHARGFRSAANDACFKVSTANAKFSAGMRQLHTQCGELASRTRSDAWAEEKPSDGPDRKAVWLLIQEWIKRFEHEHENCARNRNALIEMSYAAYAARTEFEATFFYDERYREWEKAPFRAARRIALTLFAGVSATVGLFCRKDFDLSASWPALVMFGLSLAVAVGIHGWADLSLDGLSHSVESCDDLGRFIHKMSGSDPDETLDPDPSDDTPKSPSGDLAREEADRAAHEARDRNREDQQHL